MEMGVRGGMGLTLMLGEWGGGVDYVIRISPYLIRQ
jgi:hypothetical protein